MALIKDKAVKILDVDAISRGDLIRVREAGETVWRSGIVTGVEESKIDVALFNAQNGLINKSPLPAAEIAVGMWEILWSADLQTTNHENNAPGV